MQVSNVLARNCRTAGVQGAPTSLIGSIVRNPESRSGQAVETSYPCPELVDGQVNRKAHGWGCGIEMPEEANAAL